MWRWEALCVSNQSALYVHQYQQQLGQLFRRGQTKRYCRLLPVLDTLTDTDKRKRNAVGFGEYGLRCGRRFMGNSIVKCT